MEKVSIVKCGSYQPQQVYHSVSQSIKLLGGMESFVQPGMKVLLNVTCSCEKARGSSYNPSGSGSSCCQIGEGGGWSSDIADSPGGLFTERALRGVYRACGMEAIASRDSIELNYNVEETEKSHPEGKITKNLTLMKVIEEVDAIINIAKLKTHGMALYTGAVKTSLG